MRRTAILVSVLSLAVATATTLLALSVTLTTDPTTTPPVTATTVRARAYVAAVETFLITGNPRPLDRVVAAGFVDHTAAAGSGGRDALLRTLRTMRASFTGTTLTIDGVAAAGDLAAVELTIRGSRHPDLYGIPLEPAPATWHETDVLRFADGMVAERWTTGDAVGLVAELGSVDLAPVVPVPMVALARVTYAPGAGSAGPALPGPGVLVVESGTLTVQGTADHFAVVRSAHGGASGRTGEDVAAGTVATAGAGDAIEIPARPPDARNDGDTPAVVLGIALFPPPFDQTDAPAIRPPQHGGIVVEGSSLWMAMAGVMGGAALPAGVEVHALAFAAASMLPAGPVTIGLGRVLLPPGTGLPAQRVPGLELLAVEAGTLRFDGVADPAATAPPITVAAGGSIKVQTTTAGTARGSDDGPLDLLVVIVAPARATTSPSG